MSRLIVSSYDPKKTHKETHWPGIQAPPSDQPKVHIDTLIDARPHVKREKETYNATHQLDFTNSGSVIQNPTPFGYMHKVQGFDMSGDPKVAQRMPRSGVIPRIVDINAPDIQPSEDPQQGLQEDLINQRLDAKDDKQTIVPEVIKKEMDGPKIEEPDDFTDAMEIVPTNGGSSNVIVRDRLSEDRLASYFQALNESIRSLENRIRTSDGERSREIIQREANELTLTSQQIRDAMSPGFKEFLTDFAKTAGDILLRVAGSKFHDQREVIGQLQNIYRFFTQNQSNMASLDRGLNEMRGLLDGIIGNQSTISGNQQRMIQNQELISRTLPTLEDQRQLLQQFGTAFGRALEGKMNEDNRLLLETINQNEENSRALMIQSQNQLMSQFFEAQERAVTVQNQGMAEALYRLAAWLHHQQSTQNANQQSHIYVQQNINNNLLQDNRVQQLLINYESQGFNYGEAVQDMYNNMLAGQIPRPAMGPIQIESQHSSQRPLMLTPGPGYMNANTPQTDNPIGAAPTAAQPTLSPNTIGSNQWPTHFDQGFVLIRNKWQNVSRREDGWYLDSSGKRVGRQKQREVVQEIPEVRQSQRGSRRDRGDF